MKQPKPMTLREFAALGGKARAAKLAATLTPQELSATMQKVRAARTEKQKIAREAGAAGKPKTKNPNP